MGRKASFRDRFPTVRLVWLDSQSPSETAWISTDYDFTPATITTVGFCILEENDYVVVAGSVDSEPESDTFAGVITIPRCCIVDFETFEIA